jgi:hypothetical protein
LNQLVDFHETLQGGHATKCDLDTIDFKSRNFNPSKMWDVIFSEVDAKFEAAKRA